VKTVKKAVPATLMLLAFGNMSLIMMDSGMMLRLANQVADLTKSFYPLFAPFIGVLGTFLTGNNTNSNVMFGDFQYTVAGTLGVSGAVMSAVQTIAGGLGCSIASTLVFMAAATTNQVDKIPVVLRKLIPIVLIIAAVMGIVCYVLVNYIVV
jgi:lactate permease